MVKIKNKSLCSGCHACASVCPKHCINMTIDEEGFCYPVVDESRCINCNLCNSVCEIKSSGNNDKSLLCYAAINNDDGLRIKSSSGGIFTLLGELIIDRGGSVFGAAINDDAEISHICVSQKNELYRLRGSKYVQSQIGNIFTAVKEKLDSNELVLFSGTPCQVNGLINYLQKPYPNLYTVDFICHGVPSPFVWHKYLSFIKEKYAEKADVLGEKISFRDKKISWKNYSITIPFSNQKQYSSIVWDDLYFKLFLGNYSLRPSCYRCRSKTIKRNSDITLSDFWNVEAVIPNMNDKKGVSAVWLNSISAQKLWKELSGKIRAEKVDVQDTLIKNKSAYESSYKPWKRKFLFKNINKFPFDKLVKKTTNLSIGEKIYKKLILNFNKIKW